MRDPADWRLRQSQKWVYETNLFISYISLFIWGCYISPVWCTAACHWSAVCACPSKESSSSWLLPPPLYLEAIKVLFSGKTDKNRRECQRLREKRESTSADLWSPHMLNEALKDNRRSDDISAVGEEESSYTSFPLMPLLWNRRSGVTWVTFLLEFLTSAHKTNSITVGCTFTVGMEKSVCFGQRQCDQLYSNQLFSPLSSLNPISVSFTRL